MPHSRPRERIDDGEDDIRSERHPARAEGGREVRTPINRLPVRDKLESVGAATTTAARLGTRLARDTLKGTGAACLGSTCAPTIGCR